MTASFFTAATDFSGLQFEALPSTNVYAGKEEGYEESQRAVDVEATVARIERHRAEAARATPSKQARYEAYVVARIDELRLRYHTAAEIVALHKRVTRRGVRNTLPPPSLLPRFLIALIVMDAERARIGRAVRKNSFYRAPPYNADVGGGSLSAHQACTAWDSAVVTGSQSDLHQVQEAMEGEVVRIAPHQLAVIARVCNDYTLRMADVLAGAVYGEPFQASGLRLDLVPPSCSVTVRGGQGDYRTFGHRDLRGRRARWSK